jgi:hypothetical protein
MMALMEFDEVIDGNEASHRMTICPCIFTIEWLEEVDTRVYAGRFILVFDEVDTGKQKRKNIWNLLFAKGGLMIDEFRFFLRGFTASGTRRLGWGGIKCSFSLLGSWLDSYSN